MSGQPMSAREPLEVERERMEKVREDGAAKYRMRQSRAIYRSGFMAAWAEFHNLATYRVEIAQKARQERDAEIADGWAHSKSCGDEPICEHMRTGAGIAAAIRGDTEAAIRKGEAPQEEK